MGVRGGTQLFSMAAAVSSIMATMRSSSSALTGRCIRFLSAMPRFIMARPKRGRPGPAWRADSSIWAKRPGLADEPLVLEQGQGRIDHAGRRPVGAAGALFQLLDQLVAVARLLLEQRQDDEPEVAVLEEAAEAANAAMFAVTMAPSTPSLAAAVEPAFEDVPVHCFRPGFDMSDS